MSFKRQLPGRSFGLGQGPGAIALLLAAHFMTACADPVTDQKLAALGPETPGGPGPNHRPGQPCVICHNPVGEAKPHFALAGTIYRDKGGKVPIGDVEVHLADANNAKFVAKSNCSGNFYFPVNAGVPAFPVWVSMKKADHTIHMESAIFREGDCAACHSEPTSPASAGAIFLTDDLELGATFKPMPCVP